MPLGFQNAGQYVMRIAKMDLIDRKLISDSFDLNIDHKLRLRYLLFFKSCLSPTQRGAYNFVGPPTPIPSLRPL